MPAELLHAICGMTLVVIGASQRYAASPEQDSHGVFFGGVIIVGFIQFVASTAKLIATARSSGNEDQIHSLEGCLHTLHAMLLSTVQDDSEPNIRVTVHVPCAKKDELIQVLDYVGDQRAKNTAGRRFKVQSGIVGLAYRNGEMHFASRQNDDYEAFIRELVKSWGYIDSDARKINPATRSWLAVPLCPSQTSKGDAVVYVDSTLPEFFEPQERRDLVVTACGGIARFVDSH